MVVLIISAAMIVTAEIAMFGTVRTVTGRIGTETIGTGMTAMARKGLVGARSLHAVEKTGFDPLLAPRNTTMIGGALVLRTMTAVTGGAMTATLQAGPMVTQDFPV